MIYKRRCPAMLYSGCVMAQLAGRHVTPFINLWQPLRYAPLVCSQAQGRGGDRGGSDMAVAAWQHGTVAPAPAPTGTPRNGRVVTSRRPPIAAFPPCNPLALTSVLETPFLPSNVKTVVVCAMGS